MGTPAVGVGAVQFSIFDVDLGGWTDRIQVRGFLDGNSVSPIITPGTQNYVAGNEAIGTNGNAGATSAAGNITITFNQPVDRIEWDYGNDTSAGPDPAFQIIAMHEIKMCGRRMADLSAVKTVEIYDPANLGLYMVPGNEVIYKITVTNSAAATASADDIDITDTLPNDLKFVSASTTGFTGGSFGTPDLPASNTKASMRFAPPKSGKSITKAAPTMSQSVRCKSFIAASAVPPVAIKSSISKTLCRLAAASEWI